MPNLGSLFSDLPLPLQIVVVVLLSVIALGGLYATIMRLNMDKAATQQRLRIETERHARETEAATRAAAEAAEDKSKVASGPDDESQAAAATLEAWLAELDRLRKQTPMTARRIERLLGKNEWEHVTASTKCPRVEYLDLNGYSDPTDPGGIYSALNDKNPRPDKNGAPYGTNEIQLSVREYNAHGNDYVIAGSHCRYSTADIARYEFKVGKRALGDVPKILSANAIIVDPIAKQILNQNRGRKGDRPGTKHLFGGAFLPQIDSFTRYDFKKIYHCATRELLEELDAPILVRDDWPVHICIETATNYFQCNYLAVPLSDEVVEHRKFLRSQFAQAEGSAESKTLEELVGDLEDEAKTYHGGESHREWIESGYAAYLLWLGLGAPVLGRDPVFDPFEARRGFDRVCGVLADPPPIRGPGRMLS